MARSGLYKSDVKKARDSLLALGKHPSVDAVRIALGNTGSKTTIHKYLRELEEENGGTGGQKASLSEAIQDLVGRLAAQLQQESIIHIDALRAEQAERDKAHELASAEMRLAMEKAQARVQEIEQSLSDEKAAHDRTRQQLQQETVARHTADQQVADLKERLSENESHRRSLEEKHQHAREALEHYRTSVKEQRDQDQRRHEQQVQHLQSEVRTLQQSLVVKQEEVTRLNQEGARLVADLSHAKQALYDQESQLRQLQQKLETKQVFEERCRMLEPQLAVQNEEIGELKAQLAAATRQAQGLQVDLAAAQAKLEAQQAIAAEVRMHLEQMRLAQTATNPIPNKA